MSIVQPPILSVKHPFLHTQRYHLGYSDKSVYAQCLFSLCFPGSEPVTFDGRCPGQIVPARGLTWVRCMVSCAGCLCVCSRMLWIYVCAMVHTHMFMSCFFRPEKLWLGPHFPAGRIQNNVRRDVERREEQNLAPVCAGSESGLHGHFLADEMHYIGVAISPRIQ